MIECAVGELGAGQISVVEIRVSRRRSVQIGLRQPGLFELGLVHVRFHEGGFAGPNAGDLIAEVVVAIEMGCDAEDIGLSIHPHPTLSETVGMAAEAYAGTITDLYIPKKK